MCHNMVQFVRLYATLKICMYVFWPSAESHSEQLDLCVQRKSVSKCRCISTVTNFGSAKPILQSRNAFQVFWGKVHPIVVKEGRDGARTGMQRRVCLLNTESRRGRS